MIDRRITVGSNQLAKAIGFDNLFNEVNKVEFNKFPPYDVGRLSDDRYIIRLAIAGFKKENVKISVDKGYLTVTGKHQKEPPKEGEVWYTTGIAKRDFTHQFKLHEYVEVLDASFEDGILTINLEKIIPEDKKPKVIDIK